MKMKPLAAYIRVSTVGQNEEGQRKEIERWLAGNGHSDVRWFVDKKSGDDLKRPAFDELQKAIFAGEIGTVVVYKLDRLSRSLRDGINTLGDWCEKEIRVVATSQQLDFNGSVGQLIASVLFAVAQMEQENRRERQAVGIEAARKRGKYPGRKPGTTKAKPTRALKLREKGLKPSEIASALGVSRNTVFRYFRDAASKAEEKRKRTD
jgi:DNA invertase Pin-like site-specific DNA recombinase